MAVDRSGLPGLGREPVFRPPEFHEVTSSQGGRILTAAHHRAPVLTFRLLIPVGSSDDPPGRAGLAGLTGDLLDDGTRDLNDVELHESLMRIGGHLGDSRVERCDDGIADHPSTPHGGGSGPLARRGRASSV